LRLEFKAELEREVMSLRTEFLQDRLDSRLRTGSDKGSMIA